MKCIQISCGSCSAEEDASASAQRRAALTVAAMAVLGVLVLATLVLLAAAPALITGRAAKPAPPPDAAPAQGLHFKGTNGALPPTVPQKLAEEGILKVPTAPGLLVMDVDAGADDAVAMLLALRQEALAVESGVQGPRLLAVTCTHGNTALSHVERNVLKTLHLAGRLDIPVFSGASKSLITTPPGDDYFGVDGFGDFVYENAPEPDEYLQKEHAVNALVRLAREHSGEITILATGPLTNLALATRMDPDFLSHLKQLVIMGGSTDGSGNIKSATEFNFFLDPEANFIVFNTTKDESKPIYLVPWDTVARRNLVSMEWRTDVLGKVDSKYMDFLNKAERKQLEYEQELGLWISADPVTAALILQPDLITASEHHHIDAETHGEYSRGAIYVDYNDQLSPKNTVILQSFNVEGFQELLLRNLS